MWDLLKYTQIIEETVIVPTKLRQTLKKISGGQKKTEDEFSRRRILLLL